MRFLIIILLLAGCSKPIDGSSIRVENTLGAMDKFFECLGDSNKCKELNE